MASSRVAGLVGLMALFALIAVACGTAAESTTAGRTPGASASDDLDARILTVSDWTTDFSRHSVPLGEFISGGPAKDGIRSLDNPALVSVAEGVDVFDDREPVIAVEINGEARAYPLGILTRHEIANDVVGGVPVAVTFCPLCNSAIVFDRTLDGVLYEFGVSGVLRNSDLVMYDRQTETWWQQFTGEAIVGELTGALLDVVPSNTVSWADFRSAYPDAQVLSRDTGFAISYGFNPYVGYDSNDSPFLFRGEFDPRLSPIERVVGVDLGGEAIAYPFTLLEEERVIHDVVAGTDIVVFHQPGTASALDLSMISEARDVGAAAVYEPRAGGRSLTFHATNDGFVDDQTGSMWNILGKATDGPLAGEQLTAVVHGDHFWFAWAAFKPETAVFGE
ncbi:MAG: DUF3179 domain-containing protein [Dehalococcoidia bacterium]